MTRKTPSESNAENRKSQLLKGLAELALLSLLDERTHYGLEILERLREEAGMEMAAGTIYPLLHRLERSGLVSSAWTLDDTANRPRKYYQLSESGKSELAEQASEWQRLSSDLNRFLVRRTT
ncbi:PadR family transcriptional regulator [Dokdonella sp.]|uniref:PadR family transcriptional regulator n=1 Tax=Dokdonella sp. TaxID=2291710 RepID=UPI003529ADE8